MNNKPPAPESYYNQTFVDKMNEARANIDNLVAEKDKAWSATGQKQDEYNAFQGTMSNYNDIYTQSKSEFGIEEHQDNYENSKKALALAESTLDALPSSINSSSNRVLTQSQREARYNALANKVTRYRDTAQKNTSMYEEAWKNARERQAMYASAEMASQWSKLGDYNNAWVTAMNNYMNAEKRLTEGQAELRSWESSYRTWQHQRYSNANRIWLANMSSALNRYIQALNTEMTIKQTELQKRMADTNARINNANEKMADVLVSYHWYQQAGR
jgi:hypothetical protein